MGSFSKLDQGRKDRAVSIIESWRKKQRERENEMINKLYERADQLNDLQVMKILKAVFLEFGKNALGVAFIRQAAGKINPLVGGSIVPTDSEEIECWINQDLAKADLNLKQTIFVTMAYDIFKANVITSAALIQKVDELISDVKKNQGGEA